MALILIVEDSLLSRRAIVKALQPEGYELLEVGNGLEALKILETRTPDCMVLDLLMPEMTGVELLQALQRQGKTIPAIVITADLQESSRQQCLALGAKAVLHKFLNAAELQSAIQIILTPPVLPPTAEALL
ncbi:MAG: response regulator [Leptolyngbyaceae bacterium]|nr:response regulator [Leptolyngbyaceae bacterium]